MFINCQITKGVKDKVWAEEDIKTLVNKGIELLRKPADDDMPMMKERKLKHNNGTEIMIVEQQNTIILMLPEEFSEFGEVICKYTSAQAIDDGILMNNPAVSDFPECNIITTNLFVYCKKRARENISIKDEFDLIRALMITAKGIYDNKRFQGDNDKDFFVIKGNKKVKDVWFCRNEYNRLTAMLPEDY